MENRGVEVNSTVAADVDVPVPSHRSVEVDGVVLGEVAARKPRACGRKHRGGRSCLLEPDGATVATLHLCLLCLLDTPSITFL